MKNIKTKVLEELNLSKKKLDISQNTETAFSLNKNGLID